MKFYIPALLSSCKVVIMQIVHPANFAFLEISFMEYHVMENQSCICKSCNQVKTGSGDVNQVDSNDDEKLLYEE